jgi:hypothetical protein
MILSVPPADGGVHSLASPGPDALTCRSRRVDAREQSKLPSRSHAISSISSISPDLIDLIDLTDLTDLTDSTPPGLLAYNGLNLFDQVDK